MSTDTIATPDTTADAVAAPIVPTAELVQSQVTAFSAAVKAVTLAAGKDDTLPVLTAVRVEYGPDGLTFVATDRYRLHVATVAAEDVTGSGSILVPARDLARVKIPTRTFVLRVTFDHASPDGQITVSWLDGSVTLRGIAGDYPKWRALIPTETTAAISYDGFGVNPTYLSGAAQFCQLTGHKSAPMRAEQVSPGKPAVYRPDTLADSITDAYALVMPVRLSGNRY